MAESKARTRLPKTRRVPEAFSGKKLTERSLKIIEIVGRYRFISSSAVIRLVGGNEDVTHRHLQFLYHQGLISRMKAVMSAANAEFLYFLDNAAALRDLAYDQRLRAGCLDFEQIRLNKAKYSGDTEPRSRSRAGQMLFVEHELMISDFHAGLESGCENSEGRVVLETWQQGNRTWDKPGVPETRSGDDGSLPHRPDAYFALRFPNAAEGQQVGRFFYEADRDTTSRARFKLKLLGYLYFFLQGRYLEKYGARKVRAVLIETTSSARLEQLKQTAAELAKMRPLAAALFWFSTNGLVRDKGIFAPHWLCAGDSRFRSLLD